MFTWICPKCGAEVPPSYSDCPKCAEKAVTPAPEQPTPGPSAAEPAPPAPGVPSPAPGAPPVAPVRQRSVPGWLLAIVFALVFVVLLTGGYLIYQEVQARAASPQPAPAFQPPALPSPEAVKAHPMTRHIEVTGLRLIEDNKQNAFIQFVVVNHSAAEIAELAGDVNLKAVTAKGEQEPVGTFSFKIPMLGPSESKDLKVSLSTKLRVYELPDWQFLRADVQLTSP